MIEETLRKIQARIESSPSLDEERRHELMNLLASLRTEIRALPDEDQARSIAGFADISTYEATRSRRNPKLIENSLQGLSETVTEFESAHPRLVEVVNRLSQTLSNLGI